jgi:PTS system ascorbate-specific IIA component
MPVGVITVTHGRIGTEIVEVAETILGSARLPIRRFPFARTDDPTELERSLSDMIEELDDGAGVLILTDLYGASPCNSAARLGEHRRVRVLSGINLPMVLRVLNYDTLDLEAIARRAAEGGRIGIIDCGPEAD